MRKLFLLSFIVISFFLSQTNCYSVGIDVLSSEYHVWGSIYGSVYEVIDHQWTNPQIIYRDYNEISSSPLSRSVDLSDFGFGLGTVGVSSTTGQFSLDVRADSWLCESTVYGFQMIDEPSHLEGYNDAFAEATWTFKPFGSNLIIDLDPGFTCYGALEVWLYDLTAGTELFNAAGEGGWSGGHLLGEPLLGYQIDNNISISVDKAHEYALKMYITAESAGDNDMGYFSATVSSVPEPITIFLLGFGLFGLAGIRKRCKP